MISTPWEWFTTWLFFKHSCVITNETTDYKTISERYEWLNENVGDMHRAWRWNEEDVILLRYDDILIRESRFYFRRGKDMTMFLLRWGQ